MVSSVNGNRQRLKVLAEHEIVTLHIACCGVPFWDRRRVLLYGQRVLGRGVGRGSARPLVASDPSF